MGPRWEESDVQQHQHGEPLLVEALGEIQMHVKDSQMQEIGNVAGDYARMHKQLHLILSNLRRGAVRIA